jgi:hypothetical protein
MLFCTRKSEVSPQRSAQRDQRVQATKQCSFATEQKLLTPMRLNELLHCIGAA